MNKKQRTKLLNQFAYAEYMVEAGCPRKDMLDDSEIDILLGEYLTHLISTGQVQAYVPWEDDE